MFFMPSSKEEEGAGFQDIFERAKMVSPAGPIG